MPEVTINYWAVLVSAVAAMVIGAAWYGIFATPWLKAIGKTKKDLQKNNSRGYAIAAASSLVTAFVLAHIVAYAQADSLMLGLQTGAWVWLGFVATSYAMNYAFAGRPLKLYAIDASNLLVTLLVMGGILATWQ